MTTWQLSYTGRLKYFFQKGIQRTNLLRQSKSKAPSKVKHHFMTSMKVNHLTTLATRENKGTVTLTGSIAGFYLVFYNLTKSPIVFSGQQQGANLFAIPDRNTRDLKINVNPTCMSKKLAFSYFMNIIFSDIKLRTVGVK